jgi:hypothetical protein
MKQILAALASALFAAGVSADDVYNAYGGFAPGADEQQSDISYAPAAITGQDPASGGPVTATQPGVGDSVKVYGALQDEDSSLFQWRSLDAASAPGGNPPNLGKRPDIYKEFGSSEEEF